MEMNEEHLVRPGDERGYMDPLDTRGAAQRSLRLTVGYGFVALGYAKIVHGAEHLVGILHAIGVPAPELRQVSGPNHERMAVLYYASGKRRKIGAGNAQHLPNRCISGDHTECHAGIPARDFRCLFSSSESSRRYLFPERWHKQLRPYTTTAWSKARAETKLRKTRPQIPPKRPR